MNEGYIQPLKAFPAKSRVRAGSKIDNPSGTQVSVYMLKYGILVNTKLVPPADEPKSWTDLLDPKWTGKILADDPRALGGGFNAFVAQNDKFGVDFLKKLAEQKLTFSRDLRESERRVARGEFPVYAPFLFNDYSTLRGLPVKAIAPVEGVAYVQFVASMARTRRIPMPRSCSSTFCLGRGADSSRQRRARPGHRRDRRENSRRSAPAVDGEGNSAPATGGARRNFFSLPKTPSSNAWQRNGITTRPA